MLDNNFVEASRLGIWLFAACSFATNIFVVLGARDELLAIVNRDGFVKKILYGFQALNLSLLFIMWPQWGTATPFGWLLLGVPIGWGCGLILHYLLATALSLSSHLPADE